MATQKRLLLVLMKFDITAQVATANPVPFHIMILNYREK